MKSATFRDIGCNYFEMGDMAIAKEYYGRALETAHRCGDAQLVADVHNNMGILSNVKGQIDEAVYD